VDAEVSPSDVVEEPGALGERPFGRRVVRPVAGVGVEGVVLDSDDDAEG
jgi:hypothetical protein